MNYTCKCLWRFTNSTLLLGAVLFFASCSDSSKNTDDSGNAAYFKQAEKTPVKLSKKDVPTDNWLSWNIPLTANNLSQDIIVNTDAEVHYKTDNWLGQIFEQNWSDEQTQIVYYYTDLAQMENEWEIDKIFTPGLLAGTIVNDAKGQFYPSSLSKRTYRLSQAARMATNFGLKHAVALNQADVLLASNNRQLIHAVERLAVSYAKVGNLDELSRLLENKGTYVISQDATIFDHFIPRKEFGEVDHLLDFYEMQRKEEPLGKIEELYRQFIVSVLDANDSEALILAERFLQLDDAPKHLTQHVKIVTERLRGKSLIAGLNRSGQQSLEKLFERLPSRLNALKQTVPQRYTQMDVADWSETIKHLHGVYGNRSDVLCDAILYMLENSKSSEYILRPQTLIYCTVNVMRRYKDVQRALSLLWYTQQSAMNSKEKSAGLYHDYFNGMETIIYLDKLMRQNHDLIVYLRNPEHLPILETFMQNAIDLAWMEEARAYFPASWKHRYYAELVRLNIFYQIEAFERVVSCGEHVLAERPADGLFYQQVKSKIIDALYFGNLDCDKAVKLTVEMLHDLGKFEEEYLNADSLISQLKRMVLERTYPSIESYHHIVSFLKSQSDSLSNLDDFIEFISYLPERPKFLKSKEHDSSYASENTSDQKPLSIDEIIKNETYHHPDLYQVVVGFDFAPNEIIFVGYSNPLRSESYKYAYYCQKPKSTNYSQQSYLVLEGVEALNDPHGGMIHRHYATLYLDDAKTRYFSRFFDYNSLPEGDELIPYLPNFKETQLENLKKLYTNEDFTHENDVDFLVIPVAKDDKSHTWNLILVKSFSVDKIKNFLISSQNEPLWYNEKPSVIK